MKFILLFSLIIYTCSSCYNSRSTPTAQEIVDLAIEKSGTNKLKNATMQFDFRDKSYKSIGECGEMTLERVFADSVHIIRDVLSSGEFTRYINDTAQTIPDSMANKYAASVNSVHYFVQLPWRLNDAAVNKKYLETEEIKGENYHLIEVSFEKEGGGEDFEDVYLYWIHTDSFTLDYLAYSYKTNGGGLRFREAFNPMFIEGIRFVDYNNYKPKSKDIELGELAQKYESEELILLSKILTENIEVKLNQNDCPES